MSKTHRVGKWFYGVECGQRLWRPRAWRQLRRLRGPRVFSFGPIIYWTKEDPS